MPVTWNLSYVIGTADQLAVFRHHRETLQHDGHVAAITVEEQAGRPNRLTMRVEFVEGFERPDTVELRHLDALYPSHTLRMERDIHIATPASPHEQLLLELPRMADMPPSEVMARMRQLPPPPRVPEPPPPTRLRDTVFIPKWIEQGRTYRLKGTSDVVTLVRIHIYSPGVSVETMTEGGRPWRDSLEEFVRLFEPYERPVPPRTAWERVLEEVDD